MFDAVRTSGKRVMVGQSTRFFAPFTRQREHHATGAFGELNTVEAYYNADHRWFLAKGWAKSDSFKWLYGGLSHPVDLVRWYLPDVEEVMGYSRLTKMAGLAAWFTSIHSTSSTGQSRAASPPSAKPTPHQSHRIHATAT